VEIASRGGLIMKAATFASRVEPVSMRLLEGAEKVYGST